MNTIISINIIKDISTENIDEYIKLLNKKTKINHFPFKIKIILECEFLNQFYNKPPITINYSHPISTIFINNDIPIFYDNLVDFFNKWVNYYEGMGTGFQLFRINNAIIKEYK